MHTYLKAKLKFRNYYTVSIKQGNNMEFMVDF